MFILRYTSTYWYIPLTIPVCTVSSYYILVCARYELVYHFCYQNGLWWPLRLPTYLHIRPYTMLLYIAGYERGFLHICAWPCIDTIYTELSSKIQVVTIPLAWEFSIYRLRPSICAYILASDRHSQICTMKEESEHCREPYQTSLAI